MNRVLLPIVLSFQFTLAQKDELEPLETQAQALSSAHVDSKVFAQERIKASSRLHLEEILQENSGFGLYRRAGSGIAHPTSQGISLHGNGTSAASRSLVILDGIPINDPFGGWVRWNRFSIGEIESVRFLKGSLFSSSSGTIEIRSRRPDEKPKKEIRFATGEVHGFSAGGFAATASQKEGWETTVGFQMEDFAGHPVVRRNQRGLVDEHAWSQMQAARTNVSRVVQLGRVSASLAGFDERRGNGTPLARNQGNGFDWSLGLDRETNRTLIFGQERNFSSSFTKVAADRNSESLALDQYMVPARSFGLMHQLGWQSNDRDLGLTLAAIRREGHTHEENKFSGALRRAGGRQTQIGVSFSKSSQPKDGWQLRAQLRGDWFRDDKGMRSGWALTDEIFSAREKITAGGSFELMKELSERLDTRLSLGSHVRQPTLNELYRPYRVGDFSVAANEDLAIERITKCEFGIDWEATDKWSLSVSLFHNQLRDSVSNVSSPIDPNDARRINLERARSQGMEVALDTQFSDDFSLVLSGLWLESEILGCPENPSIQGNRFPQTPEYRVTSSILWKPEDWSMRLDIRRESDRHDDARNSRSLDDIFLIDLGFTHELSEDSRILLGVNNLFDEEIQTGLSTSGIVSTGAPRNFGLELKLAF